MKKDMKFSIVFIAVILFAASSFAQPFPVMKRGKGFARRSPARILWVLKAKKEEFKITDSQLEKIQDLAFSFEEKMIQMRSENSMERLKLRQLMQDRENLDYEKIKGILSKMSSTRQNMFIGRLKLRKEIQNVLTPEQREAVNEAMKERLKERGLFLRGERMRRMPEMRNRIKR